MQRIVLKAKIHRATVTDADLNYEGSITIDKVLLNATDILPFEKVDIYNITNGERFSTYVIEGKENSGEICLNGAAARLVQKGDKIIIASYAIIDTSKLKDFKPQIVLVDDINKIIRRLI
jgi:aspartate 1-decarboxylase